MALDLIDDVDGLEQSGFFDLGSARAVERLLKAWRSIGLGAFKSIYWERVSNYPANTKRMLSIKQSIRPIIANKDSLGFENARVHVHWAANKKNCLEFAEKHSFCGRIHGDESYPFGIYETHRN